MKTYIVNAKSKKLKFNVEEYNSAFELVETSRNRNVMPDWRNYKSEIESPDKSWTGVSSYEEALNLLKSGWTENLESMKTLANKVSANGNSKRISFQNNVVGFAPIVPLAMMNVPNSMIDTRMKPIKSKVVKILYNITMSCCTDKKEILRNGMKVVEAIINLENSGYRCEVMAMQTYSNDTVADTLLLRVKEANQPLDLKRIMFPLIHPAMFRVIGFDWENKLPTGRWMSGRGRAIGYTYGDETAKLIKEAFGDNYYYIDGTMMKQNKNNDKYVENLLKGETK